jgi:hypothetical protein
MSNRRAPTPSLGGNDLNLKPVMNGIRIDKGGERGIIELNGLESGINIKKRGKISVELDGLNGNIYCGGPSGVDGDLVLYRANATNDIRAADKAAFHLDADLARMIIRDPDLKPRFLLDGKNGEFKFYSNDGRPTITCDGIRGNYICGGNGQDGDVVGLKPDTNYNTYSQFQSILNSAARFWLDSGTATCRIGSNGRSGFIRLFDANNNNITNDSASTIVLDGKTGTGTFRDVIISGADCAEEFEVEGSGAVEPGTIMVLGKEEGTVKQSSHEYDKEIVGVVSGAGSYKPGLVLDKRLSNTKRVPIALVGKVFCKVDADYAPIKRGDLLTTSNTIGHAMKADNPSKAFGAIMGKALHSLTSGRGLVPMLVSLQ